MLLKRQLTMSNPIDVVTKNLLDDIKQGGLYDHPRVDYYEFRDRWLALFNANSNAGLAPLGEWVQAKCYGNAFIPVDVIKDGVTVPHGLLEGQYTVQGGELMFTVPPILNNKLDVNLADGRTIDGLTLQSQELSKRMAVAGSNFHKKNIQDNLVFEVKDPQRLMREMDKIFEHFGVKRTHQIDGQVSTNVPNATEDNPGLRTSNDDLEFNF